MTIAPRARALALVWLALAIATTWLFRHEIDARRFGDVDDMMRLMQVEDLLRGQSWWDMHQYRIGPSGLPMHWSRLVDLPLAIVLAPLTPLLGQDSAERVAITAVPLLTWAALIGGLALLIRRLNGPGVAAAVIGVALVIAAPAVFAQLRPTRIDHHGWQIVAATWAAAALLDARPWRGGLWAGVAGAFYLAISLEGLPFIAGAAAILGLLWAFGRDRPERLVGYLTGLSAGGGVVLLLTTPLSRWSIPWCDVLLPQHVLGFAVAAGGVAVAARRTAGGGTVLRLAVLGMVAAAAVAMLVGTAPRCLDGPFNVLPPLSTRLWLDNVGEGLPLWRQTLPEDFTIVGFPLIGLAAAAVAFRRAADAGTRRRWLTLLLLLGVATVLGALVRRSAGVAHVLAVPAALALIEPLRQRFDDHRSGLVRVLGSVAAVLFVSPIVPLFGAAMLTTDTAAAPPARVDQATCDDRCRFAPFAALPPARFFTSIDLGPRLLLVTRHSVYTAAYHRSGAPMENTIRAFTSDPAVARPLVLASGADYLLVAPDDTEAKLYAGTAPNGLMARLIRGMPPAWLVPLQTSTHDLRLFRVIR